MTPDQKLEFKENGITLIYGDNGSGKSNYTRILKQVCTSRTPEDKILPNVYKNEEDAIDDATIEFKVTEEIKKINLSANIDEKNI